MEMGSAYKIIGDVDISEFTEFLDNNHPAWPNKKDDLRSNIYEPHKDTISIIFRWTERTAVWPEVHPHDYDIWYDEAIFRGSEPSS